MKIVACANDAWRSTRAGLDSRVGCDTGRLAGIARDNHCQRGVLILSLSPVLADAVLRAIPRRGSSGRFCTSRRGLDELNREVGLTRISACHHGLNAAYAVGAA